MTEQKARDVSVIEFIRTVLISDISRLIYDCKLYYLSFGVIAQGIEFLGSCLDELPFDDPTQAEKRFQRAIRRLFKPCNNAYIKYNSPKAEYYLYRDLRCGLIHMVRPKNRVVLTSRAESLEDHTRHLANHGDKLVLVAEDFFDDLKRASQSVIWKIENDKLTNRKTKETYIRVYEINNDEKGKGGNTL